jgi:hypothetical protein
MISKHPTLTDRGVLSTPSWNLRCARKDGKNAVIASEAWQSSNSLRSAAAVLIGDQITVQLQTVLPAMLANR